MQGGDGQNYPQYDDPDKQEAARFLCSDFTSVHGHEPDDHLHAKPVIRAIDDLERLSAWTEVAKEHRITGPDRRALRKRHQALNGIDEPAEEVFDSGSELTEPSVDAEPEPAVADGGAELGTVEEANNNVSREISDDQERLEYEDDAQFESMKNDLRGFVFSEQYDTIEAVEEALDDEFQRDVVRPHLVELIKERLEQLRGEADE